MQFLDSNMSECMHASAPPCILAQTDLPWAGGALDLICIMCELYVAALLLN
jgi:hypothetical protein